MSHWSLTWSRNVPHFYGIRRFITVFTLWPHWASFEESSLQSIHILYFYDIHLNIILLSKLKCTTRSPNFKFEYTGSDTSSTLDTIPARPTLVALSTQTTTGSIPDLARALQRALSVMLKPEPTITIQKNNYRTTWSAGITHASYSKDPRFKSRSADPVIPT
jgi:hypothetical protein